MNKIKKNYLKLQLPLTASITLTTMAMFNNIFYLGDFNWINILLQWLFFNVVLLLIWILNDYINTFKLYHIIIINIVFVTICSLVATLLFPKYLHYYILIFRLLVPTIVFSMLQQAIHAQKRSQQLEVEILSLRAESYKAELENLKKQLNPHFLFNSLCTLQSIIRMNSTGAEEYIIKLANLYRNMLQKNAHDKVSLREEIEILNSYLYLQKTRFERGLYTKIEINNECLNHTIPTFALQLLIENCLKHNVVSHDKPLNIYVYQKEYTSISVKNNWQPKFNNEISTKMGLANLKRRYELFGIPDGVITEQVDGQFVVTLKLF